jgi:rhodanese-related sulfurtransferase
MVISMSELPLEIDCTTLKRRLDAGEDLLVLDCREVDEHQIVRLPQAKLIPMTEIAERVGELAAYRERPIVVHCHHGGRSLNVAHWLRGQGFSRVQSLAGGIDRWATEIEPGMARY